MLYIPKKLPLKCIAPFSFILVLMKYRDSVLTTQEILRSMKFKNTEYNRKWLNECIEDISATRSLDIKKISQNTYEFKIIKYEPGTFYQCEFKDIERILNFEDGCNKLILAGYYATLISTIDSRTKVGKCYLSVLSKKIGISKKSIFTYNKILEDHEIIFMIHSKIKGKPNYYGLPENSDLITKKFYADIN